jgi:hypothetical protein
VTWSPTTAGIALPAGPKHATAFCMIPHLHYDLYQGGLVWFCGRALANLSWLTEVLSTLPSVSDLGHRLVFTPSPSWLDPGASASDTGSESGAWNNLDLIRTHAC